MSNLGEALWKMYYEKGYAEGKFKAAARYYRRGIITAEYAASDLGMTVEEFLEKVEQSENVVPENA